MRAFESYVSLYDMPQLTKWGWTYTVQEVRGKVRLHDSGRGREAIAKAYRYSPLQARRCVARALQGAGGSAFTDVPPGNYRPNPFVKIEQYNLGKHLSCGD
jgi:hypothetical protein